MATSAAYIDLDEGAAPSTPGAGKVRIYAKTDGSAYQKDDAGSETGLASGSTFVGARVYNSSTQAITTATWTSLTFNSERFDSSSIHDTGSNTSRLTIPSTGYYVVGGCAVFATNTTGARFCRLYLNNTTRIAEAGGAAHATHGRRLFVSTLYSFSASDYVEFQVYQDSGGNLNSDVVANAQPEFWIYKVG